jgi:hypothetical protein
MLYPVYGIFSDAVHIVSTQKAANEPSFWDSLYIRYGVFGFTG